MALGIDHALRVLDDVGAVAVDAVKLVKHMSIFEALKQLPGLISRGKDLVEQAPGALPELKDLDSDEAGQLAAACYNVVKGVVDAVAA